MEALSKYLSDHGMTQMEFAALISVTQPTVSKILGGKTPSAEIIRRIAVATKGRVKPNDFFAETSGEAAA